jgi:hypothetical protein
MKPVIRSAAQSAEPKNDLSTESALAGSESDAEFFTSGLVPGDRPFRRLILRLPRRD